MGKTKRVSWKDGKDEKLIREHLDKWFECKADSDFAKYLLEISSISSLSGWRIRVYRFRDEYPDEAPSKFDFDGMIPNEWDGSWADLARTLHRQRPEISENAWNHRIRIAASTGRLIHTKRNDFIIETLVHEQKSPNDLWSEVEKLTTNAIKGQEFSKWADVKFENKGQHIAIAFASDQHIGNKYTDHERMREDAELIANTPNCYIIHAGDFIDNFVIDKPRPAMKATIPPSVQWKLCEHYLDMFDDKIVAIVAGNHDLWTASLTDYDPLNELVRKRAILYHAFELNIRIWVGEQPYHISVRHKRRGNSNVHPARVVKSWWETGEADFDIGVVGHHHTPVVENFVRHGIERWAVRPGAYKMVDGYSEMLGFSDYWPTCPVAILSPSSKNIQVFSDLKTGLMALKALNGEE
tara:strand:- start:6352 stop:7581 length:1230 start_codon:yes stop_codon:yes gene_type:complete